VPNGQVVGTTPPRGTIVKKGTRVSVVVSSGPGVIGLPNVNGKGSAEAVRILREKGFQPTTQNRSSDSVEKGRVISTDPAAGSEVQVGSPVTVAVSTGPKEVSVPEVTGESQADATATLAAAGLKVTVSKREVAEPAAGTVISQTPGAGTELKVGSPVTIVVAQALKQTAAPSVVGQNEAQAVATLTNAGFASNTVSRTVTDPTKVGIVVQQSPEAGHKLAKGATITIAVGALAQQTTSTSTTTTTPPTPPPSAPAAGGPSASG
jgi:beta-lactam-binding protein with PASTA domain